MNKEKQLISFFGKSGSGKSTSAEIAEKYLKNLGVRTEKIAVAEPLHEMQKVCYGVLGIQIRGQDGKLLAFLAKHFEKEMLTWFEVRLGTLLEQQGRLVIINHDCRDNAYRILKANGFIFIRIEATDLIRCQRLSERLDVSRGDVSSDSIKADFRIDNNGSIKELEMLVIKILDGLLTNGN